MAISLICLPIYKYKKRISIYIYIYAQDTHSTATLGGPDDLEELASTCAPGSECVSGASGSSERLGRIIDQLRQLKCGNPEVSKEPMDKVEVKPVDTMVVASSDEENEPVVPPPVNESRTVQIAKLLKAAKTAKEQRLMAMKSHDGGGASSPSAPAAMVPQIPNEKKKHENPYVLPDHVIRNQLIVIIFCLCSCTLRLARNLKPKL